MQHLNNDMDELMRKAAEQYPLQPAGADWEKVSQQLQAEQTPAKQKETHWKGLIFLLSFLLASLVCNKFYHLYYNKPATVPHTMEQSTLSHKKDPSSEKAEPVPDVTQQTDKKKGASVFSYLDQYDDKHPRFVNVSKPYPLVLHTRKNSQTNSPILPDQHGKVEINSDTGSPVMQQKQETTGQTSELNNKLLTDEPAKADKDSIEAESKPAPAVTKKKQADKREKLYASLLLGPDISMVKSRKWSAGYSAGAIAGFNFGKRWSAETGLFWSRKSYYSEGAYFKTDKVALPSHSKIIHAEGYCDMFEIPLNLRFHFIQGKRDTWYALAGASSYLMKKEEYDYLYERYNVRYSKTSYYKNASRDWLSVLNMSVGYEYKLGNIGRLRLEPYLKLPLKGVGIGSLPLTSTGILVGITYPIR